MSTALSVDALAHGGSGIGRCHGKAVFIPLTAPGDRVRCRPLKEKKSYIEAELVEILEPSALRRTPPCPVFGECGGCQWQHLDYAGQLAWKQRSFADFLSRRCGVAEERLLPAVPAPAEWHYRSRVQFKCRQTRHGFVMGFYRRASHFVIDVEHCPIAAAPLNMLLKSFRCWLAEAPNADQIPQVDMELDDEGAIRVVVHFIGRDLDPLVRHLMEASAGHAFSLFVQRGRKQSLQKLRGDADLHIRPADGLRLAYGPGGFAQVNLEQNRALVAAVLESARSTGTDRVLDLYCGMGNLSLPLARAAGPVTGVEEFAPAIDKARENAAANKLGNLSFFAASAENAFSIVGADPFDLVVLDPPRTGARGLIKDLLQAQPRRILYVSCDPATLARDLLPLLHGGYRVDRARPFDLFPQTFHTESLTVLERHSRS